MKAIVVLIFVIGKLKGVWYVYPLAQLTLLLSKKNQ